MMLKTIAQVQGADFGAVQIDEFWNAGDDKEHKRHRIHAYPAKFPAFITTKALEYAKRRRIKVERIADIFCGCGTVAFEAKRNSIDFWGCDINPVATLIATAKSQNYKREKLEDYLRLILAEYRVCSQAIDLSPTARARLRYWYPDSQRRDLARLKNAIERAVPQRSHYRHGFLCAFSNILKPTSRWLTKSIKPQVDPHKTPSSVRAAFEAQCKVLIAAVGDDAPLSDASTAILNQNFLDAAPPRKKMDLLVTSPPYVTSYEYADLHQLSSLWLGYASDYRELRAGSIGSSQQVFNFNREAKRLNETGTRVVFELYVRDPAVARTTAMNRPGFRGGSFV
jgi:hypothetical protein